VTASSTVSSDLLKAFLEGVFLCPEAVAAEVVGFEEEKNEFDEDWVVVVGGEEAYIGVNVVEIFPGDEW